MAYRNLLVVSSESGPEATGKMSLKVLASMSKFFSARKLETSKLPFMVDFEIDERRALASRDSYQLKGWKDLVQTISDLYLPVCTYVSDQDKSLSTTCSWLPLLPSSGPKALLLLVLRSLPTRLMSKKNAKIFRKNKNLSLPTRMRSEEKCQNIPKD